jgi:hypothetical protein
MERIKEQVALEENVTPQQERIFEAVYEAESAAERVADPDEAYGVGLRVLRTRLSDIELVLGAKLLLDVVDAREADAKTFRSAVDRVLAQG